MRNRKIKKWFIMIIPFLMLGLNLLYATKLKEELSFDSKMILANFISFGFFSNIIFTYYALRFKFCLFSKIAILGLHTLTFLNLIYYGTDWISSENYYDYYDYIIMSFSFGLSALFLTIETYKDKESDMEKTIEAVKLAIYAFFAWLNIDAQVFFILMIFMLADSILGAIKSVRLGKRFSFKKMIWGFVLKLSFLVIPLFVALLGKGLNYDLTLSVEIVMKILIVSEAYSVFGNIYSAKNKVEVERLDIISMLLKSIRVGLKKVLSKSLNQIENSTGADCDLDKEDDQPIDEK